jgi:hypothetical protein
MNNTPENRVNILCEQIKKLSKQYTEVIVNTVDVDIPINQLSKNLDKALCPSNHTEIIGSFKIFGDQSIIFESDGGINIQLSNNVVRFNPNNIFSLAGVPIQPPPDSNRPAFYIDTTIDNLYYWSVDTCSWILISSGGGSGFTGATGATGAQGTTGNTGPTGAQGIQYQSRHKKKLEQLV